MVERQRNSAWRMESSSVASFGRQRAKGDEHPSLQPNMYSNCNFETADHAPRKLVGGVHLLAGTLVWTELYTAPFTHDTHSACDG
jgi:hypothetical protein